MSEFTIQEFVQYGLKRDVKELIPPGKTQLELGPGNTPIVGCHYLELPDWNGDTDGIPYQDNYFDTVWAIHFLEHLKTPVKVLREIQRVLRPGGTANIVVPHHTAEIAYHDLDHKCFFNEQTWKHLFENDWYSKEHHNWEFDIHVNFVFAVVQRNTCVFTQLIKRV